MTPPTSQDQVRENVVRYHHEHGLCDAYIGEDAPASEAGANISRYVSEHEDCQLYALDDKPRT